MAENEQKAPDSFAALPDSPVSLVHEEKDVGHIKEGPITNYLQGWRLHLSTLGLSLAVFLPGMEATIVATSLVAITDDFQGFNRSSWIITSYLITYTGFLIISAKLSDIFGRKLVLITSLCIFIAFSIACGAAHSLTQLIILRAFQGIGAAGTYALAIVILFELVPPEKYASYTGLVSMILAVGLLLGPILGGIINNGTSWRWVFYLNACIGSLPAIFTLIAIPEHFPHHGLSASVYKPLTMRESFSREQMRRVDFLGTLLLLSATILLVVVLEQTAIQYRWDSAFAIVLLIISGLSWILFLAWSWKLTRAEGIREPVFPWRFVQSRICIGLLSSVFFTGAPLTVAIVGIPIRAQAVNGVSALLAGFRLLPFAVLVPIGIILASGVAGKRKIPPLYLLLLGTAIQVLGFALLSTASTTRMEEKSQYVYQAIAGLGVGMNLACLTIMSSFSVEARDKSIANSAVLQFRTMGGAIGLAIVTTVLNSYVKSHLADILPPAQIDALLRTTQAFATLPPAVAETARTVFGNGFNLQMRIMIGFSAAQIPTILLMWQKKQIVI